MSLPEPTKPCSSCCCPPAWLKPHLTVFNLTVASVLGAASIGFGALIVVLLLISANFNLLGWME